MSAQGSESRKEQSDREPYITCEEQRIILMKYEEEKRSIMEKGNTVAAVKRRKNAWQRIADCVNMLSTGDLHGCLRKLETLLRVIKYPGQVDYNSLSKGDPFAFLPLLSFTLTSFSPPFAEQLMAAGFELTGKTDLRFTDALYKMLRDFFHYKPVLTKQQFLQWGFSQRKISVICDIINLVLQKHNQLKKARLSGPAPHRDSRGDAELMLTDANAVSHQPLVVNHTNYPRAETTSSLTKEQEEQEEREEEHNEEEEEEEEQEGFYSSDLEQRLLSVEAQLQSLQTGPDWFRHLERRLENLERRLENLDCHLETIEMGRQTDKSEREEIRISRESWENLMSRVLLLETKQELSNIQVKVPLPSSSSVSMSAASQEELKERLDKITIMLKTTSSVLKNTASP